MVNSRGAVRQVAPTQAAEMEKRGWKLLPSQYLDADGAPKQWYFPQYDEEMTGKLTTMISNNDDLTKPVLEVEIV